MNSGKVGFIGLGNMGKPMSRNLLKRGVDLIVYDLIEEAIETLVKDGACKSNSPENLASQCGIVILMLPGPQDVEKVCLGQEGIIHGAKKGTILIDMTSSLPSVTRRVHDSFLDKEIKMVDAPVSGMVKGAVEGTLSIMVGGKVEVFEAVKPILQILGKNIYHMGPIGSGHLMKCINNFLASSSMAATGEAMALAIKANLDPKKVIAVLQNSSGSNYMANKAFPETILPGKQSGFACGTVRKDLGIFMEICKEIGVPAFMANLVYSLWSIPRGNEDGTEFFKIYEDWFRVKMKGIIDS